MAIIGLSWLFKRFTLYITFRAKINDSQDDDDEEHDEEDVEEEDHDEEEGDKGLDEDKDESTAMLFKWKKKRNKGIEEGPEGRQHGQVLLQMI